MLKLKKQYLTMLAEDIQLQAAVAKATGKALGVPYSWVQRGNHERMTMLSTLRAIAKYCGVKNHMDLVEEGEKAA